MGLSRTIPLRSVAADGLPEVVVGLLATLIFLGALGTLELWGKREQRAAAESVDTAVNGHWLIAEIQGRPRLEKPPLPRWVTAALLMLTGRQEEWVVRLPSACSGLATVGLIYLLGVSIGGRGLGLASAMVLSTMGLFVSELRQAGNDGPLSLFTTLALFAAWRRIHGSRLWPGSGDELQEANRGARGWATLFHTALGLGFLCKGPIILLMVALAVMPYLLVIGRLKDGLRRLFDVAGILIFLGLSFGWPVLVLLNDPHALGVWTTEIGQKTGILAIAHQDRTILALAFPVLAFPWAVLAMAGVLLPFVESRRLSLPWKPSSVWFPWFWVFGNLATFSFWTVAKPSYFAPCMPGLALLVAMAWIRFGLVARMAATPGPARLAKVLMGFQWAVWSLSGIATAVMGRLALSSPPVGLLWLLAITLLGGVALSVTIWRNNRAVLALAPITAAFAVGVLAGYGGIAKVDNHLRGHRQLAAQVERLTTVDAPRVHFFHEIDEGLWFYLHKHQLAPVPGSQPRYSDSYDKLGSQMTAGSPPVNSLEVSTRFMEHQRQTLQTWLNQAHRGTSLLLIRAPLYVLLAPELAGRVVEVHREDHLKRTPLVLLRVLDPVRRDVAFGLNASASSIAR